MCLVALQVVQSWPSAQGWCCVFTLLFLHKMVKQNKPQRNVVGISESDESDDGQASPARQSRDDEEQHTEQPAKRARRHLSQDRKNASAVGQTNQGANAETEAADKPGAAEADDEMDVDEPQQHTTAHDSKQQQGPADHAGLAAQDSGCVLGDVFPGAVAAEEQALGEHADNATAAAAAEAAPAGGGSKQRHSSRQHKLPERLAPDSGRSLSRQASAKPPEKFKKGDDKKVQSEARAVWQGADKNWGQGAPELPVDAKNPASPPEGEAAVGWGFWMKYTEEDEAMWYRGKVYWHSAKHRTYWLCMEDGEFVQDQRVAATVEDCQKGDFVFCRPPIGQQPEATPAAEQEQQSIPAQAARHKKQAEHKRKHDQQRQQQARPAEESQAGKPVADTGVLPGDAVEPRNLQLDAKADEVQISGEPHNQQQQQPVSGQKSKGPGHKQQAVRKSGGPNTKSDAKRPASAAAAAAAGAAAAAAVAPGGAMRPGSAGRPQQQRQQPTLAGLEGPAQHLAKCLLKLREGATKVQNGLKQQLEALEQLGAADIDIKQTDLKDITEQVRAHMNAQQQKQGTQLCAVPSHLAATGLSKPGTLLLEKVQTLTASLWAAMNGTPGAAAVPTQQQQQQRPSSAAGDVHGKQQQQQSKQPPGTPSKQQQHQQRKLPGTPGKLGLGIKQDGDKTAAAAGEASLLDAHTGTGFAALGGLGKRTRDGSVKAEPADAAGVLAGYADAERQQGDSAAAAFAAALGHDEKLVQRFLDLVPLQPLDDPLREKAVALLSAVLQPPVAVSPFTVAHEVEQKLHAQHGIIGTGKHLYLRHLYMIWCALGGKELMAAAQAAEQAKSAAAMAAAAVGASDGGDGEQQGTADAESAAAQAAKQAEAADAAARAVLEGVPGVADAAAVRAALLSGLATVDEVFGMTSKMLGFDHQRDR